MADQKQRGRSHFGIMDPSDTQIISIRIRGRGTVEYYLSPEITAGSINILQGLGNKDRSCISYWSPLFFWCIKWNSGHYIKCIGCGIYSNQHDSLLPTLSSV